MAGDVQITVVGNLTDAPELKFIPSGAAVAKFRIASTPRVFDKTTNEYKDGEPLFLTCNVWRQAAEHVAETLDRGHRVIVTGRLRCRSYETREGEKRQSWELEVDEIGPSLRYATAKVNKMGRTNGAGQQDSQPAAAGGDPWATTTPPTRNGGGFDEAPPF